MNDRGSGIFAIRSERMSPGRISSMSTPVRDAAIFEPAFAKLTFDSLALRPTEFNDQHELNNSLCFTFDSSDLIGAQTAHFIAVFNNSSVD